MSSPLPIICYDLMIEILSWLPVKSLLRFKCVSKNFKSLISNSDLVKLNLQRAPKNVKMILRSKGTLKGCFGVSYSMPLLHNNTIKSSIIAEDHYHTNEIYRRHTFLLSCNGLICFVGEHHNCWVRLWNPATGLISQEWPCLVPFYRGVYYVCSMFGFGYDVLSDTYKAVAVFCNFPSPETHVKVCGIGDNCWRNIECFPAAPYYGHCGVYLSSTINWLGDLNFGSFSNINQIVIVSLDLGNETFRQLLLPRTLDGVSRYWPCHGPSHMPNLAVLNECLCFSHDCNKTHLVVWQMKEYGDENSWIQLFKLSYQHLQIDLPVLYLCMFEDDGILIAANGSRKQAILYNPRDNSVQHIKISDNTHFLYAKDYFQSLVSPF